ncbi:NAD-dependent epimerase [Actinoplanes cyaneus]|uniref:NAD-dependent epimerase n=1 Tax=Actinoplanes cyaneus TaxID=52696 RepID=A0A919MAH6_9ACTN|nr:NAD-dependent epimerase/dehydratase family protein [Actinoplanes cyaneus]MCW2138166.1 Nucleoside-diphosphate-sugar epimerase [Actinoplanes cyaneus]GID70538.1 NAD-dependent epimerase [Actinoplanes cyaneus]
MSIDRLRVLITGGTGFIGTHTVRAALAAGHHVRVLARDPRGVPRALGERIEVVQGDATVRADAERAADGCDALVHAAGRYSFDRRDARALEPANVVATEVMLAAARSAGLDPIVHVSTFGVLRATGGGAAHTGSPVDEPREAYLASKARAERIARDHQRDGAPVVITYPLASLGPGDDRLGDQVRRVRDVLSGRMPIWPGGGFPIGDVRDVGRLHAALLRPGLGARRFIAPGRYVTTREYLGALRTATGRSLPAVHLPASLLVPVGALADAAQRLLPVTLPVSYGSIYVCGHAPRVDNRATTDLLGDPGRTLAETMTDTVTWLAATGAVTPRQAGDRPVAARR